MSHDEREHRSRRVTAGLIVLLVLTGVMLLALLSRTAPHPPREVPPFALGPFLGASLAVGAAALHLVAREPRTGSLLAVVFALTALASFGPQKYLHPEFSRIWPAVMVAQAAIVVVVAYSVAILRRGDHDSSEHAHASASRRGEACERSRA